MFLNSLTEDPNKNASEQKFSKYSWHLNRSLLSPLSLDQLEPAVCCQRSGFLFALFLL